MCFEGIVTTSFKHVKQQGQAIKSLFQMNSVITSPRLCLMPTNGHALLTKSGEKRGGRGKRELKSSTISCSPQRPK